MMVECVCTEVTGIVEVVFSSRFYAATGTELRLSRLRGKHLYPRDHLGSLRTSFCVYVYGYLMCVCVHVFAHLHMYM